MRHPSTNHLISRVRDFCRWLYWKRRLPLEACPGAELSGATKALEGAIRSYFSTEEGRGRACQVDYVRREALHHFFAYPEDFVEQALICYWPRHTFAFARP
jgi:hypothetical protein